MDQVYEGLSIENTGEKEVVRDIKNKKILFSNKDNIAKKKYFGILLFLVALTLSVIIYLHKQETRELQKELNETKNKLLVKNKMVDGLTKTMNDMIIKDHLFIEKIKELEKQLEKNSRIKSQEEPEINSEIELKKNNLDTLDKNQYKTEEILDQIIYSNEGVRLTETFPKELEKYRINFIAKKSFHSCSIKYDIKYVTSEKPTNKALISLFLDDKEIYTHYLHGNFSNHISLVANVKEIKQGNHTLSIKASLFNNGYPLFIPDSRFLDGKKKIIAFANIIGNLEN